MFKKLASIILSFVVAISIFPNIVMASEEEPHEHLPLWYFIDEIDTCDGLIEYYESYCFECGEMLSCYPYSLSEMEMHETSKKIDNIFPATCDMDGQYDIVTYCVKCGKEIDIEQVNEIGSATGHTYDNYGKCTKCGEYHKHENVVMITEKEPTCTETGYWKWVCTDCNAIVESSITAELGHSYEEIIVLPTCTNDGTITRKCARCGDIESVSVLEATSHTYGKGNKCTVCGAKKGSAKQDKPKKPKKNK